ncbi:Os06g0516432 [Oryza sativa Japonica Group]|uniref:Os06g0516432 protein n=1 Tax=Oryza sativa subsp. japonica TaxID=39947 RepID=C7J3F8_ORYSJ|nr:Os06g0516432 [Oryza sativa Japonica Group]|eukprot:NP_001174821.1 Os06g0516432 [Oryza sativa Japonica Group]
MAKKIKVVFGKRTRLLQKTWRVRKGSKEDKTSRKGTLAVLQATQQYQPMGILSVRDAQGPWEIHN